MPATVTNVVDRDQAVTLNEIAALVAVVEEGSFTAAAQRLFISQPGFSARIARLERALGATLIDRSIRRVTLTPAGRAFLPAARELLAIYDLGRMRAANQDGPAALVG